MRTYHLMGETKALTLTVTNTHEKLHLWTSEQNKSAQLIKMEIKSKQSKKRKH